MSSKRGRKRNDNLPPNRARDVQRAFRARRAAHLVAMEERITELEDENARLRAALNLPPALRPPLGKGPTGKDRPKGAPGVPEASGSHGGQARFPDISRPGSSNESGSSSRGHSVSPSASAMRTSPATLDTNSWENAAVVMADSGTDSHPSPASTSFSHASPASAAYAVPSPVTPSFQHNSQQPPPSAPPFTASGQYSLPPIGASLPQASYSYQTTNAASTSRPPLSGSIYMPIAPQTMAPNSDRQMGQHYSPAGYMIRDVRVNSPHQGLPYSPSYTPAPPPQNELPKPMHAQHHHHQASAEYGQRRAAADPQGFRSLGTHFPHLPHPQLASHGVRLPTPPRPPPHS